MVVWSPCCCLRLPAAPAACLVAALGLASAATDVSPPVISLSLASGDYADRNCQTHACTKKNAAGHEAATCEVGTASVAASASCLLPTCKAYDHHEGSFGCVSVFKMVNNDGAVVGAPVPEASVNKDLRSEWLLTYDASDKSGNAADTSGGTMVCQVGGKPTCAKGQYCKLTATTQNCSGVGQCAAKTCTCPQVVKPVCACDGKSYNNACMAGCEGFNVKSQGACPQPVVCGDGKCQGKENCQTCTKDCGKYLFIISTFLVFLRCLSFGHCQFKCSISYRV